MKLMNYFEAMDRLVQVYERYVFIENQIESSKEQPDLLKLLMVEKKELHTELRTLSGEPLSTIERMVKDHKTSN
jgi:hypothetical protein